MRPLIALAALTFALAGCGGNDTPGAPSVTAKDTSKVSITAATQSDPAAEAACRALLGSPVDFAKDVLKDPAPDQFTWEARADLLTDALDKEDRTLTCSLLPVGAKAKNYIIYVSARLLGTPTDMPPSDGYLIGDRIWFYGDYNDDLGARSEDQKSALAAVLADTKDRVAP